jgi:hypothetical protein
MNGAVRPIQTGSTPRVRIVQINDLLVAEPYVELLQRTGLDRLSALCRANLGVALRKASLSPGRERLCVALGAAGGGRTLYVKRFCAPPSYPRGWTAPAPAGVAAADARAAWGNGLHGSWRMKRRSEDGPRGALREWERLVAMREAELPVPPPVAWGERWGGDSRSVGVVVMEAVPGQALEDWALLWERGEDVPSGRTLRGIVDESAELVARLHAMGWVHRDLYLAHLFFDPAATIGRQLHLIDVQRVERPRLWLGRWVVKDLAALASSTPDWLVGMRLRVRWLRRYLAASRRLARRDAAVSSEGMDARTVPDVSGLPGGDRGRKLDRRARSLARRVMRKSAWVRRRTAGRGDLDRTVAAAPPGSASGDAP